jgi:hypothetical protein
MVSDDGYLSSVPRVIPHGTAVPTPRATASTDLAGENASPNTPAAIPGSHSQVCQGKNLKERKMSSFEPRMSKRRPSES